MIRNSILQKLALGTLLAALPYMPAAMAQSNALRVGTAKVDITPADPSQVGTLWEVPYTGIHDHTYARVIVLDNGATSAAIVAIDTVELTHGMPLVERIARETGIPAANILLAASHAHSAPMWSLINAEGQRHAGPGGAAFLAKVESDLVAGLKQAKAHMTPARVGTATGIADININRDALTPTGYDMGRNPAGPSDKTVWVMKFESLDGMPLALLVNYAVHATMVGPQNTLLSADLPGAVTRHVEQALGGNAVVLWTTGPAGDQHPTLDNAGDNPEKTFKAVDVLGEILGDEVVRVAANMQATSTQPRLLGLTKSASCPGQKAITGPRPPGPLVIPDAPPVTFPIGVLMVGNTALASVGAEVNTTLYWQLRKRSPFTNTILLTLTNGRAGYIAEDDAYTLETHEAIGSAFKKGCAASTLVNGLSEMLQQF